MKDRNCYVNETCPFCPHMEECESVAKERIRLARLNPQGVCGKYLPKNERPTWWQRLKRFLSFLPFPLKALSTF